MQLQTLTRQETVQENTWILDMRGMSHSFDVNGIPQCQKTSVAIINFEKSGNLAI